MEAVKAKDEWLNSKWSAQNKLADHQDPAVYASVVLSEKKVNVHRHIHALQLGVESNQAITLCLVLLLFEIS